MWKSFRGASWNDHVCYLRAANRHGLDPDYRGYNLGFRVACEADPGMVVVRGGSWLHNPVILHAAIRSLNHINFRLNDQGFRIACEVEGRDE